MIGYWGEIRKRIVFDVNNFIDNCVTGRIVVIRVKDFQTELMVEIYSMDIVRAIGKVLLMKVS